MQSRGPADLRAGQGRRAPPGQGPGRPAGADHPGAGTAQVGAPGMTGKIRMCRVCGTRPPAMREIPCCFQCWPGGPVTPPPCRRCGSHRGLLHLRPVRPLPHPRTRAEVVGVADRRPARRSRLLPGLPGLGRDPHLPVAVLGVQGVARSVPDRHVRRVRPDDRGRQRWRVPAVPQAAQHHRPPRGHPDRPRQPGRGGKGRPAAVLRRRRHVPPGRPGQAAVREEDRAAGHVAAAAGGLPAAGAAGLAARPARRAAPGVPAAARSGAGGGVRPVRPRARRPLRLGRR